MSRHRSGVDGLETTSRISRRARIVRIDQAHQVQRLAPGLVSEALQVDLKKHDAARGDHRRKSCLFPGCVIVHLKGSDYCYDHDDGSPPRKRRKD